jgi:hypothetical protein
MKKGEGEIGREILEKKIRKIVREIGKGFCGGFSRFFGRRRVSPGRR